MAAVSPFLRTITDAISHSKLAGRLVSEARDIVSAKRKAAFEELETTCAALASDHRKLAAVEAKASEGAAKAAAVLAAAQRELFAATQARQGAAHRLDRTRADLERRVLALAPPELDSFLGFLQATFDGLRLIGARVDPGFPGEGAYELIRAAQARIGELRLSAATDEEILAELRQTRDKIMKGFRKLGGISRDLERAADFEGSGPQAA